MNFIPEQLHSNCCLVLYINYRTNDNEIRLKVKLLIKVVYRKYGFRALPLTIQTNRVMQVMPG